MDLNINSHPGTVPTHRWRYRLCVFQSMLNPLPSSHMTTDVTSVGFQDMTHPWIHCSHFTVYRYLFCFVRTCTSLGQCYTYSTNIILKDFLCMSHPCRASVCYQRCHFNGFVSMCPTKGQHSSFTSAVFSLLSRFSNAQYHHPVQTHTQYVSFF